MGDARKVVELPQYRNKKLTEQNNSGGGGGMDNYVTHKDLDDLKEQLNNSLQLTEKNIQLMFRDEREYHRKNKNESVRWIIGTGIAVVSLIFTYLKLFAS
ncbi:hypothetical protein MRP26_26630 [Bacillus sp. CCB-MMP212]|uniref:hypothetical protein n=1 Tax=Bacillus sp. CCB-MMP212 TaxID=2928002 RepID=UPI001F617E8F|nr:hypothetical protein [Bacillus sp. CCB-MMP212]MCI4252497.1 hypothetical protein [Bacillus sp. CCB-MMP212]